jgi:hypothetical protein
MWIRIHSTGVNEADIDGALYRPTNNVVDKIGGHLSPAAVVEAVEERDEVSEAQQHQHVVVAVYKNQVRTASQHFELKKQCYGSGSGIRCLFDP